MVSVIFVIDIIVIVFLIPYKEILSNQILKRTCRWDIGSVFNRYLKSIRISLKSTLLLGLLTVFKCTDEIYLIGDVTFLRLTPEMVNCLAAVNKILVNTNQQQSSLLELYQQHHRVLDQTHSLKQFDLGFKKVRTYFVCKKLCWVLYKMAEFKKRALYRELNITKTS